MNLRFLCIFYYFCFAGVVMKQIVHPPIVEEMFVFLLYECVHLLHLLYVLFFLLSGQLLYYNNDIVLDPRGR